jgi:hypothetical protein
MWLTCHLHIWEAAGSNAWPIIGYSDLGFSSFAPQRCTNALKLLVLVSSQILPIHLVLWLHLSGVFCDLRLAYGLCDYLSWSHAKLKLIFCVAAFWEAMLRLPFSLVADSAVLFTHCRDQRMSRSVLLFTDPCRNAVQGWHNPSTVTSTVTVSTKFWRIQIVLLTSCGTLLLFIYSIQQSRSWQADSRPGGLILGVLRDSKVRCRTCIITNSMHCFILSWLN